MNKSDNTIDEYNQVKLKYDRESEARYSAEYSSALWKHCHSVLVPLPSW